MEYANYTTTQNFLVQNRIRILIAAITLITIIAIAIPVISTVHNRSFPLVQFTKARSGNLDLTIEAVGEIKIDKQLQDILKLEKVVAQGDWKVKGVKVTNDDEVKKGTVLAVIDLDDLNTQIRMRELQISKLQLEIERRINSITNIADMTIQENDAQRALFDMNKLQQDLGRIRDLYKNGAESLSNVQNAEKEVTQAKLNYESKLKLIDLKKEEINRSISENNLMIKQTNIDIEIKKTEINLLKTNLPLNGEIKTDIEGKVKSIYVVPGLNCSQGKVLFEIEKNSADTEDDKSVIQWKLDGEQGALLNVGDEIFIDARMPKEMRISEKIKSRQLISYDSSYVFTCPLRNSEQFQNGQQVRVYKTNKSAAYDKIIPKDSIVRSGYNMGYIYICKKNYEASSKGEFVQQIPVEIKESNDTECAVSGDFDLDDKIVKSSNKTLSDGMQVRS